MRRSRNTSVNALYFLLGLTVLIYGLVIAINIISWVVIYWTFKVNVVWGLVVLFAYLLVTALWRISRSK